MHGGHRKRDKKKRILESSQFIFYYETETEQGVDAENSIRQPTANTAGSDDSHRTDISAFLSWTWTPLSSTNTLALQPFASTAQKILAGPSSRPLCIPISHSRTLFLPSSPFYVQPETSDTTSSRLTSFRQSTHVWSLPQTPQQSPET